VCKISDSKLRGLDFITSCDVITQILLLVEMSEEFLKFMPVLVELVMKNLAPKKVAGKLVTGSELMTLLQAYVNNFKNGVAPKPKNMIKVKNLLILYTIIYNRALFSLMF
jgi:hypothetical protein